MHDVIIIRVHKTLGMPLLILTTNVGKICPGICTASFLPPALQNRQTDLIFRCDILSPFLGGNCQGRDERLKMSEISWNRTDFHC